LATSYIGFKGSEDLGNGLKAQFNLETFLRADTGEFGRFGGDVFWARAANVGLSSGFGTISLGRNTPALFVSTLIFNAFTDSFGFSPSIQQYYLGVLAGDSGWSNSGRYQSPNFGGLSVDLIAAEGTKDGPGRKAGGNLLYFGGAFSATFAYQKVEDNFSPFFHDMVGEQSTFQFGGAYDFGAFKLFGQYGEVDSDDVGGTADTKAKIFGIGATMPIGAGSLMAQYGQQKFDNAVDGTRKTLTVGYDYFLSKRTDLYAVYMGDKIKSDNGDTFAVGVKHSF
jgi:predicted porin